MGISFWKKLRIFSYFTLHWAKGKWTRSGNQGIKMVFKYWATKAEVMAPAQLADKHFDNNVTVSSEMGVVATSASNVVIV